MPVILRRATWEDAERLLAWRNDGETRRQSITEARVSPEEHHAWMTRTLGGTARRRLYIAEHDGHAIGTGRLESFASWTDISLTVAPAHRGQGYARRIIRALVDEADADGLLPRLVAVVKPDNLPSLRAFLACGFVPDLGPPPALLTLEWQAWAARHG